MASFDTPNESPAGTRQRFLLVEDHPMFREAVRQSLSDLDEASQIVVSATLLEALERIDSNPPFDLAVIDLDLPDSTGIATFRALKERLGNCHAVVFSGRQESSLILRCLEAGASGYLPKTMNSQAVMHALQLVLSGNVFVPSQAVGGTEMPPWKRPAAAPGEKVDPRSLGFTDRQIAVLRLILRGMPNKLICRELNLAEGTIKVHVSAVLRVLGVRNRTQAIIAARELGLQAAEEDAPVGRVNRPRPATPSSFAVRPPA